MSQAIPHVCTFIANAVKDWKAKADHTGPGPVVYFVLRSGTRIHGHALGAPRGELIELTQLRGVGAGPEATIFVDPGEVAVWSRAQLQQPD
jgi:hypothetical protein